MIHHREIFDLLHVHMSSQYHFLSIYLQEQKLTDKENETIANVYYGLGEAGAFQSAVKIYAALKAKGIKKIGLKKIGYCTSEIRRLGQAFQHLDT